MPKPEKIALTVSEAAEAIGVSEKTIRRAIESGVLVSYRPTRRHFILVEDLLAWVTTDRQVSA